MRRPRGARPSWVGRRHRGSRRRHASSSTSTWSYTCNVSCACTSTTIRQRVPVFDLSALRVPLLSGPYVEPLHPALQILGISLWFGWHCFRLVPVFYLMETRGSPQKRERRKRGKRIKKKSTRGPMVQIEVGEG